MTQNKILPRRLVLIAVVPLLLALAGCGGSDTQTAAAQTTTPQCVISASELGPFSAEAPLGQSMDEDQARARMAQDDIIGWVAVNATGPWDALWDQATATLGQGLHVELTWLDVNGTISGLYETGDQFAFTDLRVSRSFQGKIEHTETPLYLPLQDVGLQANLDATCTVTALEFGDPTNDQLLDVFDATPSSS
jgi:hypothetical protein